MRVNGLSIYDYPSGVLITKRQAKVRVCPCGYIYQVETVLAGDLSELLFMAGVFNLKKVFRKGSNVVKRGGFLVEVREINLHTESVKQRNPRLLFPC